MFEKYNKEEEQEQKALFINSVSDNDIDDLLNELDSDAQGYDNYSYGLPICGEELKNLRATVRTWLQKSGR